MTKELNELTAEELGELFPIKIVGYKPEWKDLYHLEEQKIREAIGKNIFKIQHIGSTAVPGLSAKPTIDILVEIYEETNNEFLLRIRKKPGNMKILKRSWQKSTEMTGKNTPIKRLILSKRL